LAKHDPPPEVVGALKALDIKLHELHTTFGDATRLLCYDNIHDTRSDDHQAYSDAFDEWSSQHPILIRHFIRLADQRTTPAAFRAFFDFYIETVALGVRHAFTHLMKVGREHKADGIAWAEAQAIQLIERYRPLIADWVRVACDRDPTNPWLAPAFLIMEPAGHNRYDPDHVWDRMDAATTPKLLDTITNEYVRRLKRSFEKAAKKLAPTPAKREGQSG
jgi:hypothetical protein